VLPDKPDERLLIQSLSWQLDAVMEASDASPGLKAIIAVIFAARYARRSAMPAFAAAAMLFTYIARGDPF
jgi:hypothetical protein